jgi:tRNA(fMet)-specific endonuclease VapC
MSLFVLDSDTLSLLQAGHEPITARASERGPGEIAIAVISVDEQLRGWYSLVRRAKKPQQIAHAYDRLARSVSYLSATRILPYTISAIAEFEQMRRSKMPVGSNDLRIAAIAREYGATVVTRNVADFRQVPGLLVEDWSQT